MSAISGHFHGFIEKSVKRKTLAARRDCVDETACRSTRSKDKDENRASGQLGEKQADHVTSEQTADQICVEFAAQALVHIG